MNTNQHVIDACNEMIGFLEDHTDLPNIKRPEFVVDMPWGEDAKPVLAEFARAGATSLQRVEKEYTNSLFYLTLHGESLLIQAIAWREEVCERVQVGTEKVTEKQLPEGVDYVEVEVEKPVYKWSCGSLLKGE